MGSDPPSDEWKRVDRGRRNGSLWRPFLNRNTLLVAFKAFALAMRLIRLLKDLSDDV